MQESLYNPITCCYFPATTILIDDDEAFLGSFITVMDNDLASRTFISATPALQYFRQYESVLHPETWMKALSSDNLEAELADSEQGYVLDFLSFHKIIYNPKRFEEVTAVICDYSMPEMNGVEVFAQLNRFPFKKFLLTGAASAELGLEAFNDGVLDRFAIKRPLAHNFVKDLMGYIRVFQREYFIHSSQLVTQRLRMQKNAWINEYGVMKLFQQVIRDRHIVEYYLVSENGCFLMLDAEGEITWFVLSSEAQMQYFEDSARDNDAPEPIIQALTSRKKVLFLFSKADNETVPYTQWENYLHPATPLQGKKRRYYYSVVEGKSVYAIDTDNVVSYRQYLDAG